MWQAKSWEVTSEMEFNVQEVYLGRFLVPTPCGAGKGTVQARECDQPWPALVMLCSLYDLACQPTVEMALLTFPRQLLIGYGLP